MPRKAQIEKCMCPQCNEEKELTEEFYGRDKTRKSGWYRICKACDAINQRAWRAKRKAEIEAARAAKEQEEKKATVKVTRRRTVKKEVVA